MSLPETSELYGELSQSLLDKTKVVEELKLLAVQDFELPPEEQP